MYVETWRWRFVLVALGGVLAAVGVYGILHPDQVPLNICYSPNSLFLRRLNTLASTAAFLVVATGGGLLIWAAAWSARKHFGIREDRVPFDWAGATRTVVAYLLLLAAVGACVWFAERLLGDIRLQPLGPAPEDARDRDTATARQQE